MRLPLIIKRLLAKLVLYRESSGQRCVFCIFVSFFIFGFCLNAKLLDSIATRMYKQLQLFPQEKIYMHIDKPVYLSGENIWFKIYLTDAIMHYPFTSSRYAYVELINPLHEVIERIKVVERDSLFTGYIPLADTLVQGTYTLRAYTQCMENAGEEFFFKRVVEIGDPLSAIIRAEVTYPDYENKYYTAQFTFKYVQNDQPVKPDKITLQFQDKQITGRFSGDSFICRIPSLPGDKQRTFLVNYEVAGKKGSQYFTLPPVHSRTFNVSFFPEGGHLLSGEICTIGFKALNSSGRSEEVTGEIYDQNDKLITEFISSHQGMGRFILVPESEKEYYAICKSPSGIVRRFDLPSVQSSGVNLECKFPRGKLAISLKGLNTQEESGELYIVGHTRGLIQFYHLWENDQEHFVIDKNGFLPGVMHILLVNQNYDVLSERLIFCDRPEYSQMDVEWSKPSYGFRDKVEGNIWVKDSQDNPLSGHFSIAVTDNKEISPDRHVTIMSHFLLTSDLKGYIENPQSYFEEENKHYSDNWLDNLMLTQGWRRYKIPEVIKGNYMLPDRPMEISESISGMVRSLVLKKPVSQSAVTLSAPAYNFVDLTETDENGYFRFDMFEFPDSTSYFINAHTKKGSDKIDLIVNERTYPDVNIFLPGPVSLGKENKKELYWSKANEKYTWDYGMRLIHLKDVEVTAPLVKKRVETSPLIHDPDHSLTWEDIQKYPLNTLTSLFLRVPGIKLLGNYLYTGILQDGPAMILLDGFLLQGEDCELTNLESFVHVSDIAQVDILKSPRSVIVSSRSTGGVIAITTRKGNEFIPDPDKYNSKVLNLLGYQQPIEFYSPVYETPEQKNSKTPDLRSTLFWEPAVKTNEDGKGEFRFYSADFPTDYNVIIEGITWNGEPLFYSGKIRVEQ